MKHIWKYLRHYKKALVFTFSFKFLSALTEMLIPSLLEKIVDKIIPTGSVPMVVAYGCVMAACAGFAMFSNVIANRNSERTAGSVTESLRHELFEKISHLSAAQIDYFTTPSLVSRLTSDSYNVNRMIARLQRVGVRAPILLISGLCITLLLDPVLSLVLAAMLPFVFGLIWFITRFSVPVYTGVQRRLDTMVRTVQENVTGVRVVKALSKVDYERRRFDNVNTILADEEQRGSALMSVINPTTTLILNLGLTLIVLAGAHRANSGLTEPGKIMAFLSYFTIILNALLGISKIFLIGSKGIASARRIEEVLDAPADMAVLPAEKEPVPDAPTIAFENVCFSYNKVKHNLEDLSFRLERGQTLGIIGPTGSGKTTILNLLLRLYDPDSGTVRLNGRDIRTISREELSHRFGVVLQNDFIMSGSIRENLDYGRNLPEADLLYAAETAQAMSFIAEKGGLDADIDIRAANLSGGQKQRLLIARALAGRPEILVLDDASSALDYKTDAAFRHTLASNYPEITRVIVAQRVSSIRSADLILMLDDGNVLASGTHDSLYATCSEYRLIADAQMGGETHA